MNEDELTIFSLGRVELVTQKKFIGKWGTQLQGLMLSVMGWVSVLPTNFLSAVAT